MASFSELDATRQLEVAELFLRLPSFGTPGGIQSVIARLPQEWRSQIRYSPGGQTGREETLNLLQTCAAQPDGFSALLASVRFYDGTTLQYAALIGRLADLGLRDNFPATCWMGVPQRLTVFAGRDAELQQLQDALAAGERAAICAVHGMGGVGKTSLATEYAHRYRDLYGIVGWFRLADDYGKNDAAQTKTSVLAGYAALASSLNLVVAQSQDYDVIRRAVAGELAKRHDWLLVFDNAEDPAALRPYLPDGKGHILITSRTAHWHGVARPVALDVWDEPTALKFLLKFTGRTVWQDAAEAKAADELVKELGGLPLAVHQAAAYMAAAPVGVAAYLKLFGKHKLKLFQDKPLDYHAPVTTTWDIGVEALAKEQPAALLLLNLCAFLAPEPIRFELLQEARERLSDELAALLDPDDELALMDVKKALRRYALATVSETSLALHRLMGLVTRERLSADERRRYAEYAARAINKLYPSPLDYDNWERCEELLRHAEYAAEYAEAAEVAAASAGRLYNETGLYLQERAVYSAARRNYERAVALGERTLAPDDPTLATYYNNLGLLLQNMGDLPAANSYLERAIAIREKVLGIKHPDVAQSYNNLGTLLQDMGDLPTAKSYYERATAIKEKVLGTEHPSTAISYSTMGLLLKAMGDLPAAKSYLERAISIGEQTLGKEHPDVATWYNNLGMLLQAMGDLPAAKSYYERAIAIDERVHGKEHPEVATDYLNYGVLLYEMGEGVVALDYLRRALAIWRAKLGEQHPKTQAAAGWLAHVEAELGLTIDD